MDDESLLTLCAFEEANLEPNDGIAAIVKVIQNRIRRKFFSDGTVRGTIFAKDQFSWTGWAMSNGRYVEVAGTPEQMLVRANTLLAKDSLYKIRWGKILTIVRAVLDGTYSGPDFNKLTSDTVLYLNPKISHTNWATPDKLVCEIGNHNFYKA